jgi:hypothetical protein
MGKIMPVGRQHTVVVLLLTKLVRVTASILLRAPLEHTSFNSWKEMAWL